VILRAICRIIKRTTQLKKLFVIGFQAIAALVLGAGLWTLADDHNASTPAEVLSQSIADADAKISDELQIHVNALAKDGCASQANRLATLHAERHINNASEIPSALRSDLELCIGRGVMLNYVKGQLKDAGLWALLQPAVS
jgi:hypothetical protein